MSKRKPAPFDEGAVNTFILSRCAAKRAAEHLKGAADLFNSAAWCEKRRQKDLHGEQDFNAQTARTLIDRAVEQIDLANFLLDENKTARAWCPDR